MYCSASVKTPSQKKQILPTIAILGDSIINFSKYIKSEFNKSLRTGRARFKHFPGVSSKDLLHYIDPTLEQNFEAAIIHI